eukprot:Partr_v1_DN26761_c2_g1_i2_m8822 putative Methyltransferase
MKYYPSTRHLKSVTFVDSSRQMLEKSVEKFEKYRSKFLEYRPWYFSLTSSTLFTRKEDATPEIPSAFVHADACNMDFPDNSFDTVVDTFGLCSVDTVAGPNPLDGSGTDTHISATIRFLNELARVCRPDGKVYLLEHGIGNYSFINLSLNKHHIEHFKKWGCWWNRDIEALVEASDLEIEYSSRWHFGTTYYIVARPKTTLEKS